MPASASSATTIGDRPGRDGADQRFGGAAGIELVTRSVGARADDGGLVVVAGDSQHRAGQPSANRLQR